MNGTMVDLLSGYLSGDNISESKRTLGVLKNVFQDEAARAQMNPATIVYEVQSHMAVCSSARATSCPVRSAANTS